MAARAGVPVCLLGGGGLSTAGRAPPLLQQVKTLSPAPQIRFYSISPVFQLYVSMVTEEKAGNWRLELIGLGGGLKSSHYGEKSAFVKGKCVYGLIYPH